MTKRLPIALMCLAGLIAIDLFQSPPTEGQEPLVLKVAAAAICRDVVDHEPINVGNSFPSSAGKLWCFTRVVGALSPTEITHVWSFGEVERARVNLPVDAPRWRTYSSKLIQPHETGDWRVDVLDQMGETLMTLRFKVTAPPSS